MEKDNSIGLTFSCGIAGYPVDAQDKDDLLKHAGEALYMAKYGGRNAVCIYSP
mgnify:FL=1